MGSFKSESIRRLYNRFIVQIMIGGIISLGVVLAVLVTGMYLLITLGFPFYFLQILTDSGLPNWAVIGVVTLVAVGAGLLLYKIRSETRLIYGENIMAKLLQAIVALPPKI